MQDALSYDDIERSVFTQDEEGFAEAIERAISRNPDHTAIRQAMLNGLDRVRKRLLSNESSLPELLISLDMTTNGLDALQQTRMGSVAQSLPVLSSDHRSVTTDAGRIQSAMFAFLVDRCSEMRQAVFFVSTIGTELEEMARSRHGLFHQWVFDKIGAELIEIVADDLECSIRERLFNGQMQCSRRISPGYCDWPLDGQRVVFRALDADMIDVTLSSRMVMTPCKSISGVLVAAQTVGVINPCSQCMEKQCRWRVPS